MFAVVTRYVGSVLRHSPRLFVAHANPRKPSVPLTLTLFSKQNLNRSRKNVLHTWHVWSEQTRSFFRCNRYREVFDGLATRLFVVDQAHVTSNTMRRIQLNLYPGCSLATHAHSRSPVGTEWFDLESQNSLNLDLKQTSQ